MVGPIRNKKANFHSIADLARSDSSPYSRVPELHSPTHCQELLDLRSPGQSSHLHSSVPLLKVRFSLPSIITICYFTIM